MDNKDYDNKDYDNDMDYKNKCMQLFLQLIEFRLSYDYCYCVFFVYR